MPTELDRVLADAVSDVPLAASADIRARGNRRSRRTTIASGLGVLAAVTGVMLTAGLLPGQAGPTAEPAAWSASHADPLFQDRAVEVAGAWQSSGQTDVWKNSFVPLNPDFTVAPVGGFPDGETKEAFADGSFQLSATLPDTPADATVTFADRSTMTVPIVNAETAYDALIKHPARLVCVDKCRKLAVVRASLSVTQVPTSRGMATVPAWQFHVTGIAEPIMRVAVAPAAVTPMPKLSLPQAGAPLLASHGIREVGTQSIKYSLYAGGCGASPAQPQVWESDDVIVIGGLAGPQATSVAVCPLVYRTYTAEVTLARPVGNRVILEAVTGQPLVGPTGTVQ